ncbi:MAG: transporter substrate-binding domain-containing protein, partial [Actinomycetota bacterium]
NGTQRLSVARGGITVKKEHVLRLLALLLALVFVAAACGSDDDSDEGADSTEETDTDSDDGDDEDASAGEDEGDDGDTTVELTQDGGTLAAVIERGELNCGGNDTLPGFGIVDDAGEFSGFDVDYCRVVAAAVLGDADAVNIVPLTAEARFTALQSGEIDVLIRNTTWTATRDGVEGANFLFTTFYDGQGMMVPASTGFTGLEDLADASICVLSGTTT